MFCDLTQIYVKAGNGGNGAVSFRREKYLPKGGPDGGDGGNGGDIVFKVNPHQNTLFDLNTKKRYKAEHGEAGMKRNRHGKSASDLEIEVPLGTQIFDAETKALLFDFLNPKERFIAAKGGRGGYGNAHFTSSVRQAPDFAENGEKGEEKNLKLELKLVADVGIIGLPSAGKSTLIAHISNARPKIAEYHFTTLIPNLGVTKIGDETLVISDIPGLIEGASEGKGLGHEFLRHIARNSVLIHVLDGTLNDLVKNYQIVQNELQKYSVELAQKKQIVVLNKIDSLDTELVDFLCAELQNGTDLKKTEIYPISAVTGAGIKEMLYAVLNLLHRVKKEKAAQIKEKQSQNTHEPHIFRPHLEENPRHFTLEKVEEKVFRVHGKRIEQIANMTEMTNTSAVYRLYDVMQKLGVSKQLKREGMESGDLILIGEQELPYKEL